MSTNEGADCFRCGIPAEPGWVVSDRVLVWSTGSRWARTMVRGEKLARMTWVFGRAAEKSGYRCGSCRVCWFDY